MKEKGPGSPGAPTEFPSPKERGEIREEKIANNSLISSIEQKTSDKSTPTPAGGKKTEKVTLYNPGRTVFDCAVPKVVHSPFHIRRMLRDEIVTEEQAQELEQQWLGSLKAMDRRSLKGEFRWWKMMRDRFTEEQKREEAQEIEQQLEVIREQLRQREID